VNNSLRFFHVKAIGRRRGLNASDEKRRKKKRGKGDLKGSWTVYCFHGKNEENFRGSGPVGEGVS